LATGDRKWLKAALVEFALASVTRIRLYDNTFNDFTHNNFIIAKLTKLVAGNFILFTVISKVI
jgi:hypothetical protein